MSVNNFYGSWLNFQSFFSAFQLIFILEQYLKIQSIFGEKYQNFSILYFTFQKFMSRDKENHLSILGSSVQSFLSLLLSSNFI